MSAAVTIDDLLVLQDNMESALLVDGRIKRTSAQEPNVLADHRDELLRPSASEIGCAVPAVSPSQDLSATARDRELLALSSLDIQKLPFIGRTEELETLNTALRKICCGLDGTINAPSYSGGGRDSVSVDGSGDFSHARRGRGLVLIHGEPGIGKSKLAEQLKKIVQFPRIDSNKGITRTSISENDELEHPPTINESIQGFAVYGKFDSTPMNEPYAVIRNALGEICMQIRQGIAEEQEEQNASRPRRRSKSSKRRSRTSTLPSESEKARTHLCRELKRHKLDQALGEVIPNLSGLLSVEDAAAQEEPGHQVEASGAYPIVLKDGEYYLTSFCRLKDAFRRFVQIVSRIAPIVLVLDDCQWADEDSVDLIKSWVSDYGSDPHSPHSESDGPILITLCYRDDRMDEDHILTKMIAEIRTYQRVHVFDIPVGALDLKDVSTLLTVLLDCNPTKAQALGEVCFRKTGGNLFFVMQFLLLLWETEHLKFNLRTRNWMWSMDSVRQDYEGHPDNIEDLMHDKIQRISVAKEILPIAACLGSTFQAYTLIIVMMGLNGKIRHPGGNRSLDDMIDKQTHGQVQQCIRHGFLEQGNYGSYKFVNAKVQDAALACLSKDELTKLRFSIGDILLESFTFDEMEGMIFQAVNLVNFQATSMAKTSAKRLQIASLNLDAGKHALNDFSAFKPASKYLHLAIELLPDEHWIKYPKLSTEIYSFAAFAAYCAADFDKVKRYSDEVSRIDHLPMLQKLPMYHTMMDTNTATNRNADNLQFGQSILNDMGVKIPRGPSITKLSSIVGMVFTKRKMRNLSLQLFGKMPIVSDPQNLGIMKTLYMYATAAMSGKPEFAQNVLNEMERRTERLGLTAFSALAFSLQASLYSARMNDNATADACCSLALSIAKRCQTPGVESRCIAMKYSVSAPCTIPLHQCLGPLFDGYSAAIQEGAVQSSFACMYFYLEMSLYNCQHLLTMEDDLRMFERHVHDFKHGSRVLQKTGILQQAVRTLRGEDSAVFDDEQDASSFSSFNEATMKSCDMRSKMYVLCYMGQHEDVAESALEWYDKCVKYAPGEFSNVELCFVTGVSCFAMTRATGSKKYQTLAMKSAKHLKRLAALDNPNVVAYNALLAAEAVSIRKHQAAKAVECYERAIVEAGRMGRLQVQALANERFALYLDELGYIDDARYRMTEAMKLYAEWGAMAKVEQLELHSPLIDTPNTHRSGVEIVFELES